MTCFCSCDFFQCDQRSFHDHRFPPFVGSNVVCSSCYKPRFASKKGRFVFCLEVTPDLRDPDTGRAVGKEKPEKPFAFEDTVFHVYHAWFRGRSWEDDLLLLFV